MKEAAVMIIIQDGLILGVSRKNDSTKFGLPGGKLEPHELPKDAAVRETFEETGLQVKNAVYLYRRDEVSENNKIFHTYCYLALDWEGTLSSSEEGIARWLTAKELTGMSGAFPEYNMQALNELKKLKPKLELI